MFRVRGSSPRKVPDDVYAELVAILYRTLPPVLVMVVVCAAIGTILTSLTGDGWIAALAVAGVLASIGRAVSILAYGRRAPLGPMTHEEVRSWELWFGIGSIALAVITGAFNVRALAIGGTLGSMLITGPLFGYCAGMVIRLSVRPWICWWSLAAAVAPTVIAFLVFAGQGDAYQHMAYLVQAGVIIVFAIGGMEMASHTYHTTLEQLVTKHTLSHLARKDDLTGLANRLSLRERFDNEIVRIGRSGDQIALHYLDLDAFKAVNDNYGHPAGDRLLVMVAERLTSLLRGGDTAARLGGDEFVVVQTSIQDAIEARVLARRLVRALSAPYIIDGHSLSIGASVGIALAPDDGIDLDELGARADSALYQAKSVKRGSIAFWREPKSLARHAA